MRRVREILLNRRDAVSARLLVNILEKADPEALVHSIAVAEIASVIGKLQHVEREMVSELWLAALLHDIGKLGVPDQILKATHPSHSERRYFRKHVTIGKFMVDQFFTAGALGRSVEAHHERFDGKGYPRRLKGKDIPFYARVVAVADYYDVARSAGWLLTRRSHETVMQEISDDSGKRFDPDIVSTALRAEVKIQLVHKKVHGANAADLRSWL